MATGRFPSQNRGHARHGGLGEGGTERNGDGRSLGEGVGRERGFTFTCRAPPVLPTPPGWMQRGQSRASPQPRHRWARGQSGPCPRLAVTHRTWWQRTVPPAPANAADAGPAPPPAALIAPVLGPGRAGPASPRPLPGALRGQSPGTQPGVDRARRGPSPAGDRAGQGPSPGRDRARRDRDRAGRGPSPAGDRA